MNLSNIPEHMHAGIIDYVEKGYTPGSFFNAVLCNKLMEAALYADDVNKHCLFEYADLLYNELPRACWGSQEAVDAWIEEKRKENA